MSTRMLIDARHPEETRVAVLKGNRIEEFDFESADHKQIKGNIYLAKVTRVEPSLQAAFVDFGGNRHGFLAFSEIHPDYYQIPKEDREALLAEEAAHAEEEAALRAAEDEEEDEDDNGHHEDHDHDGLSDDFGDDGVEEIDTSEKDDVATIEDGQVDANAHEDESGDGHADGESEDDQSSRGRGRGGRRGRRQGGGRGGQSRAKEADELRAKRLALRRRYKIQDVIQRRQVLLVQVVKEERREQPVAPPGRPSRAGRNLPAAIGVGLLLGAAIVASLLLFKPAFLGIVAVAAMLGVRELWIAFQERGIRFPIVPVAVGGVGMLVVAYFRGEGALAAALALTTVAIIVWRLTEPAEGYLRDASAGVFAAAYVPFLAGFSMLMTAADHGAQRVLVFLILVVCNDTGGYATGVLAGRHPMAPTISPKKSWEGLAGSVVTAAGAGAITMVTMLHGQAWQGAVTGVAVVASATLGDLCESMIKRDLGIKDMGNLLPGHGGIMDRLDSLLPTAPVAWLLLSLFVPVK